jgi:hypothetical protein
MCVALSADQPGISFGYQGPSLYEYVGDTTFTTNVTIDGSMPPGTRVQFAAWAVWMGLTDASAADCISTPAFVWSATVE